MPLSYTVKGDPDYNQEGEKEANETRKMETPLIVPSGSGAGGGTRAGLFRTPISGGVQSATSAHGLPRPALAVRNLMEQVKRLSFYPLNYLAQVNFLFFLMVFVCIPM